VIAAPVIVERRYNGPPDSGNGGWTAGLVASLVDSPQGTVVTLRVPPPLETPLEPRPLGTGIGVYAPGGSTPDGTLVAEAAPDPLDEPVVPPVSWAEAHAMGSTYPGLTGHPFPTCFVCGPDRAPGDGLRLFPGRPSDGRTAAAWTVPGDVSAPLVWAALDCPGGWSIDLAARPFVLGRLAVRIDALPEPGEHCVVMGELTARDGRKARVRSTLYGGDGRVLAGARATWLAIPG
jgi:hypothetical protein